MTDTPNRLVPAPTFGFSRIPTTKPHPPSSTVWVTASGLKVVSDVLSPPAVPMHTYVIAVGRKDGSRRPTDDEFAYACQAFAVPMVRATEQEPTDVTRFIFCPA